MGDEASPWAKATSRGMSFDSEVNLTIGESEVIV